jgi:membrane protein implicated in regulation of membrane protease activity
MMTNRDRWRRRAGLLFVATAAALLVGGETIGKTRLRGWAFLLYWTACLVFTALAMLTAWLDSRAVRRRAQLGQTQVWNEAFDGSRQPVVRRPEAEEECEPQDRTPDRD